jgi:hypothetical protein
MEHCFLGVYILKHHQQKKIMIILVTIGFFGAGFLPIISSSNLSYKQNTNLPIGFEVAQKVAETKIYLSKSSDYLISETIQIKSTDDSPIMYIFFLNPTGYIVIPANKNLPPIIAFSFENEFGAISKENILLQLLKTDISSRIDHIDLISENIIKNRDEQWQKYSSLVKINQQNLVTTVGPLLDTKWSQNAPYNNFCPIDLVSKQRSVAGCPAVAMAQILNYHRTTQNIQFSDDDDYNHNYGGNRYTIDDDYEEYDFPSFPELNIYLDTLQYNYENEIPLTDEDLATINFACGVAAKQVYNPKGSGTFSVNQAYDAYQRFGFEDIQLLTNEPDVYTQLQSNILEGYPAHIAVVDKSWSTGHNMVVDGYDDEGYFHINFGWGGSNDGWYMLPKELPYELTVLEGLIVDIKPNSSQSGDLEGSGVLNWIDVKPGSTITGNFIIKNNGDPGSSIDWEVTTWPSWGNWTFTPDSGIDLTPEDGELTINVEVIAPEGKNKEYADYVKIVNTKNSSDNCLIHISLTTPKNLITNYSTLRFLKQHFYLFLLLKNIINLK